MITDRASGRFSCSRVQPGQVHKSGFVTKLGGAHDGRPGNWKKRFMVLKDDLYYYEDQATYEKGKEAKGVIRLDSFFCVRKDGENPEHEFTIFAVPKPLVCHAESKEELESWVKVLTRFGR